MRVASGIKFAVVPEWILDAEIPHIALRLYAVLDRYAGNDDGKVVHSRRAIAARLRCSRDTLDRALSHLEGIGALRVEQEETATGVSEVNTYVLQPGGPAVRQGGRTDAARGGRTDAVGVAAPLRHIKESLSTESLEEERTLMFAEFYAAYPHRKDRKAARRAWDKRVKDGADPEALIEATRRFAAWVDESLAVGAIEAMSFVKHPATWLNKGSDSNELVPPVPRRRGKMSAAEGFAELDRRLNDSRRMEANGNGAVLGLPDGQRNG